MIYDISKITGDTRMTPVTFHILYVIYNMLDIIHIYIYISYVIYH